MNTTLPSLGIPQPIDEDWQQVQAQIDAVVHEQDPPVEEPPTRQPPIEDPPARPTEDSARVPT
jgi:hypothetical protein